MTAWACRSCRSINANRATRCYKCHAPRDLVKIDPATELLGRPTGEVPRAAGAPRGTRLIGIFVTLVIWVVVVLNAVAASWSTSLVSLVVGNAAAESDIVNVGVLRLVTFGMVLASLVLWGLWVSLVLANLPRLDAGWPAVTPGLAFLEHLIPVWNIWRTSSLVRIILIHLPGRHGPDDGLLTIWILPLVTFLIGSWLVGRFTGLFISDLDTLLRIGVVGNWLSVVALAISAAGATLIVSRVEDRQALASERLATGHGAA